MVFQPVIPLNGYTGWLFLQRTQERQVEAFDASPELQREVDYFRENIKNATDVADLVTDRTLLKVALGAFGLQDEINKQALVRRVLEEGTIEQGSFANRLNNSQFKDMANEFSYGNGGFAPDDAFVDKIINQYKQSQFEVAVGEVDQDMRLSLNFQRKMGEIAARGIEQEAVTTTSTVQTQDIFGTETVEADTPGAISGGGFIGLRGQTSLTLQPGALTSSYNAGEATGYAVTVGSETVTVVARPGETQNDVANAIAEAVNALGISGLTATAVNADDPATETASISFANTSNVPLQITAQATSNSTIVGVAAAFEEGISIADTSGGAITNDGTVALGGSRTLSITEGVVATNDGLDRTLAYQVSLGGQTVTYIAGDGEDQNDIAQGITSLINDLGIAGVTASATLAADPLTGQAEITIRNNSGNLLTVAAESKTSLPELGERLEEVTTTTGGNSQSVLSEKALWFQVMGDQPLRAVFETAFGLPTEFSQIDIDQQQEIFEERSRKQFGVGFAEAYSNPENIESLIKLFTVRSQIANGPSATTPGFAALSLLQNAAGFGASAAQNLLLSNS
ncbi:DUF1217 domain-containing protein [Parvularcula sp. IMCC14364]|uniref:DUF1217 domain-containing protein n=1 Tax=Parvularcula sp. IMCC14364 TaxID=3067902 RepID=UPI0027404D62|nr:DUF1217 domain-containing protein [Parvularcula sp. IMCC14364]